MVDIGDLFVETHAIMEGLHRRIGIEGGQHGEVVADSGIRGGSPARKAELEIDSVGVVFGLIESGPAQLVGFGIVVFVKVEDVDVLYGVGRRVYLIVVSVSKGCIRVCVGLDFGGSVGGDIRRRGRGRRFRRLL